MNSLKLSIKDIEFIQPLFHLSSFLAISPKCDFGNSYRISQPISSKIYGGVLISLRVIVITYILISELNMDKSLIGVQMHSTDYLLKTLSNITQILFSTVTITKALFCEEENWAIIMQSLRSIDETLGNRGKRDAKLLGDFYSRFILGQVCLVLFIFYDASVWLRFVGSDFWVQVILYFSELYVACVFVMFVHSFLISFESRYQDLNDALHKYQHFYKTDSFLATKINRVRKIGESYRILGEAIEAFNTIFGYSILLLIIDFAVQLINCVSFAQGVVQDEHHLIVELVLSNIMLSVLLVVSY